MFVFNLIEPDSHSGHFTSKDLGLRVITCQRREQWGWTRRLPPRWAGWRGWVYIPPGRTATRPPGTCWRPPGRRSPAAAGPPEPGWTGTSWVPSTWTSPTDMFSSGSRFPPDPRGWWFRRPQRPRCRAARCCTDAAPRRTPTRPGKCSEPRPRCPPALKRIHPPETSPTTWGGWSFTTGESGVPRARGARLYKRSWCSLRHDAQQVKRVKVSVRNVEELFYTVTKSLRNIFKGSERWRSPDLIRTHSPLRMQKQSPVKLLE